jgi:hypothetical protein
MNKYLSTILLALSPIVVTGFTTEQIILNFTNIGNTEFIIFASLIGYGIGVFTLLFVVSVMSIISSGLDSLVGALFWFGAHFSLTFGGLGGAIIGVGCAIFTILQMKLN